MTKKKKRSHQSTKTYNEKSFEKMLSFSLYQNCFYFRELGLHSPPLNFCGEKKKKKRKV